MPSFKHIQTPEEIARRTREAEQRQAVLLRDTRPGERPPWPVYHKLYLSANVEAELGPTKALEHVFSLARQQGWTGSFLEWYKIVREYRDPNGFRIVYCWPKT